MEASTVGRRGQFGSWLAAGCLAVLTLSVFWVSRDTGPESTVRRFHQSLLSGDAAGVSEVLMNGGDGAGTELASAVSFLLRQTSQVSLGRVRSSGRTATVDVVYVTRPSGGVVTVRYVVSKPGLRWRVDALGTLRLLRRMQEIR